MTHRASDYIGDLIANEDAMRDSLALETCAACPAKTAEGRGGLCPAHRQAADADRAKFEAQRRDFEPPGAVGRTPLTEAWSLPPKEGSSAMIARFRRWLGRLLWALIREGVDIDSDGMNAQRAKALQRSIEDIAKAEARRVVAMDRCVVRARRLQNVGHL